MNNSGYDEEREERIMMEATVDAYDDEERAMGWYYYLTDKICFPFDALCIKKEKKSPLKEGEQVRVLSMSDEAECLRGMYVEIEWNERRLSAPLGQLYPLEADEMSIEAVEDWHYWIKRGYEF